MALITLLTDFGFRDGYVGAMKGVIASLAPDIPVIDICHEIDPRAVRRAGMVWCSAVPYFPSGTVHVAVVDPGVGSRRKILAVKASGSIFLAPDNGLIGYVLGRRQINRVFQVKRKELFLEPLSDTFHGRDIFAPVAARLAMGMALEKVGPALRSYHREGLPGPRRQRKGGALEVRGEVVDFDRFGNATTNLRPPVDERFAGLEVAGRSFEKISRSYAFVRPGQAVLVLGSLGYLEVAVREGSARTELGLDLGDRVVGRWRK